MISLTAALMLSAFTIPAATQHTLLDQGSRQMYNLNFTAAHRAFAEWEKTHPDDPMGPVSDAGAYLFAEFDRLHILQSEFFTDDNGFLRRERSLTRKRGRSATLKTPWNAQIAWLRLLWRGLPRTKMRFSPPFCGSDCFPTTSL